MTVKSDHLKTERRDRAGSGPWSPWRRKRRSAIRSMSVSCLRDLPEMRLGHPIAGIDVRMDTGARSLLYALDVSERRAPLDAKDDVEVHSQLSSLQAQAGFPSSRPPRRSRRPADRHSRLRRRARRRRLGAARRPGPDDAARLLLCKAIPPPCAAPAVRPSSARSIAAVSVRHAGLLHRFHRRSRSPDGSAALSLLAGVLQHAARRRRPPGRRDCAARSRSFRFCPRRRATRLPSSSGRPRPC